MKRWGVLALGRCILPRWWASFREVPPPPLAPQ